MHRYRIMTEISRSIKKHLRQYTQLITAVLYNCHLTGFTSGRIYKGPLKGICAPGLNCYSCPGAVVSCPLGSLQGELLKSAYRLPLYILGTLILFGVILGRIICGFLCPFGFVQEIIDKIPLPKIKKSKATRVLSYLKYVILVLFVIIIPLGGTTPGFCKYICPAGTIEAGIPLVALDEKLRSRIGWLFSWKVLILIICIVLCAVCYRAFCRFFCPLGALYSLFNPVTFFGIKVDQNKCTSCNACIRFCKMDVREVGDRECIRCGECRSVCPEDAIDYCCGTKIK